MVATHKEAFLPDISVIGDSGERTQRHVHVNICTYTLAIYLWRNAQTTVLITFAFWRGLRKWGEEEEIVKKNTGFSSEIPWQQKFENVANIVVRNSSWSFGGHCHSKSAQQLDSWEEINCKNLWALWKFKRMKGLFWVLSSVALGVWWRWHFWGFEGTT